MIAPPQFSSIEEFRASRSDVERWKPYLDEILKRHGIADSAEEPVPGFNPTYPTFICGEAVVKLFGHFPAAWRESHAGERAAHELLATDPEIVAPAMLGHGRLFDAPDDPWLYLVTRRIDGTVLWRAELSDEQRRAMAAQLGEQISRVHALNPAGIATDRDWPVADVAAANQRSSLPPHLIAQIDNYLADMELFNGVFLNGDLVANHVYLRNDRIIGIIDWGDAIVTDRHYEIIQIFRDTFNCDKTLLRVFLDASNWPETSDFPRKAMQFALIRQAVGLIQHGGIDVFEPIAEQFPLHDIATLDELSRELFGV